MYLAAAVPTLTRGGFCERQPEGQYFGAYHARERHGAVLICWRHHHLHTLAHHIVGDRTTIPQNWNEDRYDLVWVFDLDPATGNYVFREVAQELLDGDL